MMENGIINKGEEMLMAIMGKIASKPLLFQSRLLCFSLFYLFTSLSLAIYFSLSPTKCLFRSSPFDPVQTPFFTYPPSYGVHKYALPTLRSSCSSPVFFSDYWMALKEIQELCRNSSRTDSEILSYIHGNADSFGGNLRSQKRFLYSDRQDEIEIPCGFFKDFPISNSDRIAMEKCKGVVVVSAIFGDHDKIRQPRGLGSKTLDSVCFFMFADHPTLKRLQHHNLLPKKPNQEHKIGVWRLVNVSTENLYTNAAMNGMIPKYLVHRLFPNSKYSIWVDAKLQLVVDPLLLIHSLVVMEDVDMAISRHPYFVHTMEEAMATARWKKWWDVGGLRRQMETYCENGLEPWSPNKLPYPSDVPDSALILRKHGVGSNLFSCLLFNELEAFNPRDQLGFAYVRDRMKKPRLKMNMFDVEVFEQVVVEYRHNLKNGGPTVKNGSRIKKAGSGLFGNDGSSFRKCEGYLLKMWGESHD